jgi:hypothetical protein
VSIEGVLTTPLGAVESGRGGFVQDTTAGIGLYLDATVVGTWPAGTRVRLTGSISSRFAQRVLRVAERDIEEIGTADLPASVSVTTGDAGEVEEGLRVIAAGGVTAAPDVLADGLGVTIDDGSGPLRTVIAFDAVAGRTIKTGVRLIVTGSFGQHDSSGAGTIGYRVHVTLADDLVVLEPASTATSTPTPTAALTPTPTPRASSTPAPTATARPTAPPSPGPSPTPVPTKTASPAPTSATTTLASVRTIAVGTHDVVATGVVTAVAGRLGTAHLLAIGDATGGLVVRLPAGISGFSQGTTVRVTGTLAAPYGQLEIRPASSGIAPIGTAGVPTAITVPGEGLSEGTEARLVTTTGRLVDKPKKTAGGDITVVLEREGAAPVKVSADASSGLKTTSFTVGITYRVVGIGGQRATRNGALDGYRMWLRDRGDLTVILAATTKPSHSPGSGRQSPSPTSALTIAAARRITDRAVAIEATVTAPATLLDATGRRIVVQDASGAIEVALPTGDPAPPVGSRVRVLGRIGVAYGAPRLKADHVDVAGSATVPAALVLHGRPDEAQEWRLVRVSGPIESVHKLGDRWRAEIRVGSTLVPIVGQPGSGIAVTAVPEGRTATVTGIVRRPYPSASDHRFSVLPRFPADLDVAPGGPTREGGAAGRTGPDAPGVGPGGLGGATLGADSPAPPPGAVDADLADLASFSGQLVRVGGLVVALDATGFTLDDGTSVGRIVVAGEALPQLPLIEPDDAINAIGRVEVTKDGPVVVVDAAGAMTFGGDPVAPVIATAASIATPAAAVPEASQQPQPDPAVSRLAGIAAPPWPLDAEVAGVGSLLLAAVASIGLTIARRERGRRRLTGRIAVRLAGIAGPSPANVSPSTAKRGPSTPDSA